MKNDEPNNVPSSPLGPESLSVSQPAQSRRDSSDDAVRRSATLRQCILTVDEPTKLTTAEAAPRLADAQLVEWVRSRTAASVITESDDVHWGPSNGFVFYSMTFRFMTAWSLDHALRYYDTFIDRTIHKLCGFSRQRITVIREPEIGSTVHQPIHIHAIVGIPAVDHVIRRYERSIGKRCGKHVNVEKWWRIRSDDDLRRAYGYMRKRKTRRLMA